MSGWLDRRHRDRHASLNEHSPAACVWDDGSLSQSASAPQKMNDGRQSQKEYFIMRDLRLTSPVKRHTDQKYFKLYCIIWSTSDVIFQLEKWPRGNAMASCVRRRLSHTESIYIFCSSLALNGALCATHFLYVNENIVRSGSNDAIIMLGACLFCVGSLYRVMRWNHYMDSHNEIMDAEKCALVNRLCVCRRMRAVAMVALSHSSLVLTNK